MTTKELMDLPIGARVRNTGTGVLYEKVRDPAVYVGVVGYRCSFAAVGKTGLSKVLKRFPGWKLKVELGGAQQ